MVENWPKQLKNFLESCVGHAVTISEPIQLSGGAIQNNWSVDISITGGEWDGFHQLVLRSDAASSLDASHSRAEEFNLIKVAYAAGVMVPKPFFLCEDPGVLGRPFFMMQRHQGITAGHILVKKKESPSLVYQLGVALARIHAIKPPQEELLFLESVPNDPAKMAISKYREYLDDLGDPHPVIEWGLSWLEANAPPSSEVVLCHRDF